MATSIRASSSQQKYNGRDQNSLRTYPTDIARFRVKSQSDYLEPASFPCPFCDEAQSSTEALGQHLMLCGNKTDQCPKCRRFIQRAVFAYHYENNCASLPQTDTPPRPSRAKRSSESNSNRLLNETEPEQRHASSNYRLQTTRCQFCAHECASADYAVHQGTCLANPKNKSERPQRSSSRSSTTEGRASESIVRIPCEFCDEQVDLAHWSTHTQDCREKENRRLEARAQSISRERVNEQLRCDYCQELLSLGRLAVHELVCLKNPERISRPTRLTNTHPSSAISLLNTTSKNTRDSVQPTRMGACSSLPPSNKETTASATDRLYNPRPIERRLLSTVPLELRPPPRVLSASRQSKSSHGSSMQLINSASGHCIDDHSASLHSSPPPTRTRSVSLTRPRTDEKSCSYRAPSPSIVSSRVHLAVNERPDSRGSQRAFRTSARKSLAPAEPVIFHGSPQDTQYEPTIMRSSRRTKQTPGKLSTLVQPPWKS